MNYAEIKYCDIANGTGVRTSLFVSGCTHHCTGCFNEIAWDFAYGHPFTRKTEDAILDSLALDYVSGLTLLGGEPMEPANQSVLAPFLERVRERYPHKETWCYTGYTYDRDLRRGGRAYTEDTKRMLSCVDILVDGEFVQEKADISLRFRGSGNQRILHLQDAKQLAWDLKHRSCFD